MLHRASPLAEVYDWWGEAPEFQAVLKWVGVRDLHRALLPAQVHHRVAAASEYQTGPKEMDRHLWLLVRAGCWQTSDLRHNHSRDRSSDYLPIAMNRPGLYARAGSARSIVPVKSDCL